jgi:hypothetical protein
VSPPEQFSALRTLCIGFRKAKENMGQCKSKERDFKSYANTVFRRGCCCLSAGLSTEILRKLKRTWNSVSLRKETLKNRKKKDFRSRVLKVKEKNKSKRRVIREKKQ